MKLRMFMLSIGLMFDWIGRQLTENIWNDIFYRLHVRFLRVYLHGQEEWIDGIIGRGLRIRLDENDRIKEIDFQI